MTGDSEFARAYALLGAVTGERDRLARELAEARAEVEHMRATLDRTTAILSSAKIEPADGDDRERFVDERVDDLRRERDMWRNHADRLDHVEMDHAAARLDLEQQVERLTRELDEARAASGITAWAGDVRLAAKFAEALPREDEIDSVMSLLNWCRANHDADSAARLWLERAVSTALSTATKPREES